MTRNAERVHTDPDAIAAIQRNIERLPNGAHVLLGLEDGSEVTGIVAARPIAQMFFGGTVSVATA